MDVVLPGKRFTFTYDDADVWELPYETRILDSGDLRIREFLFPKGLKVTHVERWYPESGACEWVNHFENVSDGPTGHIRDLYDADFEWSVEPDPVLPSPSYLPETTDGVVKIEAPIGSEWSGREFQCNVDEDRAGNQFPYYLRNGEERRYTNRYGRSSDGQAPYFNVLQKGKGHIVAVGWSGQWVCLISRADDKIRVRSGIEKAAFRMLPGEKFRTSSVVVMEYGDGLVQGHNQWRRLVKEHFSPMRRFGEDATLPFSALLWGGMSTDEAIGVVDWIDEHRLPFDCIWVDAGWYGPDESDCPDVFTGDWYTSVGDWRVNRYRHPDGMRDLAHRIHASGRKFLLWFEPERAHVCAAPTKESPQHYLSTRHDPNTLLYDLGDDAAREAIFTLLSGYIDELGIDIFRQDCNLGPLGYWLEHDTEERAGIREIKHINGLYDLWDRLLEKHPGLLIDNCASGGNRLDIEAMRRSVPLWRSDAACPANGRLHCVQNHAISYNAWMPYSGTSSGRNLDDPYRLRSAYAAGYGPDCTFVLRDPTCRDPVIMARRRTFLEEYLKVRPYLSCDFYPLTRAGDQDDIWSAVRYDRPEKGDGILLAFRRENSPFESARFEFLNAAADASYVFSDADSGEEWVRTTQELEEGLEVVIPQKRQSKLFFYRRT